MTVSHDLLSKIDQLDIRIYSLVSGKFIVGEVIELYENGVELNYACTFSCEPNGSIRFAPAVPGENVPTAAVVYSDRVEYESFATLRLKKYYFDYLTVSKVSAYTNENISMPSNIHKPLDPKGLSEESYWNAVAKRLLP